MKILLHACCGPCSIYPLKTLREEGHIVTGYFFNPNIHPFTEYQKRLDTFRDYADKTALPLVEEEGEGYRLDEFLREVSQYVDERCRFCYEMRLRKAAQAARRGKYDAFTTTLLVSPWQKHDLIREIAAAIGEDEGIPFYYQDFRPGYQEGVRVSKEENMYRQKYCGCIYSERDRYKPKNRRSKEGN